MLEYGYQSATVCLVSTTAIFRLPFAVNVMLNLLVIVSVYHFQKKDVVYPVLPRNVLIGQIKTFNFKTKLSAKPFFK